MTTPPPPGAYPPPAGSNPPQGGYPPPQPGYAPPQPGYAPPQPGFPAPQAGYPAPQAGYPGPQPGYPPAGMAGPPKKSHTLRNVLIIVGVVLALCVVGGSVGGYLLFRKVVDATQPQRDAVHSFLRHLENGDIGGAYDDLCADTREQYTQTDFTVYVATQPRVSSHDITAFDVSSENGQTTATVTAQLHYTDGTSESHTFEIAKDGGEWHVCGDPY